MPHLPSKRRRKVYSVRVWPTRFRLRMRLAFAEHRTYDAVRLLRMAADHEDAAEKHPVTPGAVRPARELLGDLLMEMHQPKEALLAYQKVLAVAPGRRKAVGGAAGAPPTAALSRNLPH